MRLRPPVQPLLRPLILVFLNPNTSRLLHQLEIYLGVRLFDRDKNRLSMTREGLKLGPEIRPLRTSSQLEDNGAGIGGGAFDGNPAENSVFLPVFPQR